MIGYYECVCEAPKVGDGRSCAWPSEKDLGKGVCDRCDLNARCVGQQYCECNSGFQGDGFQCVMFDEEEESERGVDDNMPFETTTGKIF